MTPAELAEHLKEVPPFHLTLITLAWELADANGEINRDQAQLRMEEILIAKNEASSYVQATHLMLEALTRCLTRDL